MALYVVLCRNGSVDGQPDVIEMRFALSATNKTKIQHNPTEKRPERKKKKSKEKKVFESEVPKVALRFAAVD
jgi:hypothetical protein